MIGGERFMLTPYGPPGQARYGRRRTRSHAILIETQAVPDGEMAEWLKAHAWKACIGETLINRIMNSHRPLQDLPGFAAAFAILKAYRITRHQ